VTLDVILTGQAPAGALSGEVTITSRDGERLVVPVMGEVIKVDTPANPARTDK